MAREMNLSKDFDNYRQERLCKLLFTSRFIPIIEAKFQSDPMLEVRASEEDVKRFIAGQISRLPVCIKRDDELICKIQSKVVKAVNGM